MSYIDSETYYPRGCGTLFTICRITSQLHSHAILQYRVATNASNLQSELEPRQPPATPDFKGLANRE